MKVINELYIIGKTINNYTYYIPLEYLTIFDMTTKHISYT